MKCLDLLIHACNRLKRRLVIVGTGPDEKRLKKMAGSTIEFVGRVSDEELGRLYSRCRAFLFASDEDFGIAPVEAQSYGRSVIAYGHGGSLETVLETGDSATSTGIHFPEQTVDSVCSAILRFEASEHRFRPDFIQEHSRSFSTAMFFSNMSEFVGRALTDTTPANEVLCGVST